MEDPMCLTHGLERVMGADTKKKNTKITNGVVGTLTYMYHFFNDAHCLYLVI